MPSAHLIAAAAVAITALLLLVPPPVAAIRGVPIDTSAFYAEAPHFRNGDSCPAAVSDDVCNPAAVHIAMTLDASYLRGSVAAVHSLLKHAACPDLLFFHFIAAKSDNSPALRRAIVSAFPNLHFQIYRLAGERLAGLISPSVRVALENPLNYARTYLADLLPLCVRRVVYLDSDLVAVDDVRRLFATPIPSPAVIAAPEYCHANFTRYFNSRFWSDNGEWGGGALTGRRRRPCYFNTGVMVMDLMRWRMGRYTKQIEDWMMQQRERGIYELGSLPPFLLVFAGDIEAVEHRWNVHGLGGDNVSGSCRPLHPGPVSLLHWSGKGKPWDRLDAGTPCPVDRLWAPYDLYVPPSSSPLFASW